MNLSKFFMNLFSYMHTLHFINLKNLFMIFSNQNTCTHLLGAFRGHVCYSVNPSNSSSGGF